MRTFHAAVASTHYTPPKNLRFVRLEPTNDPRTIEEGIEARIKDPLWMMGRQRQMGEFRARDSASVVRAEMEVSSQDLTRIRRLDDGPDQAIDRAVPLEAQVEAEPPTGAARPPYWRPDALEYGFELRSETGAALVSDRYRGDRLDWFDFDLSSEGTWGEPAVRHLQPTRASFPGAPDPRWWALEDRRVDLGGIERPQLNVLGLLAMEFALLFENDWYLVPLEQRVGRLRRVDRLTVVDSFGFAVDADPVVDRSSTDAGFEVFTLAARGATPPDGRVFLAPNVRHRGLRGEPLESVTYLRDEGANLAWAVEHRYTDEDGRLVRRDDESRPPDVPPRMYWDVDAEVLVPRSEVVGQNEPGTRFLGPVEQYEGRTWVPPHWIPYQPLRIAADGHLVLRRSRTQLDTASGPQYRSSVVGESIRVSEQAISRLGTRVERAREIVRATDGRRVSWTGRRVLVDEHREPSGLRFDALLRPER